MQYPRADRDDQPGLFRDAEEVDRLEETVFGMLPPNECLDTDHLRAGEGDDRLVVHAELFPHERAAQRALDLETTNGPIAHRLVEQLDAPPSQLLGREHGYVRVAQEPGRRVVLAFRDDRPDARIEEDLVGVQRERLIEHTAQAPGERDHVLGARDVVADDRQLVAAEARQPVAGPQHSGEPPGNRGEQLIAGFVAEAVVDDLEVVEIEDHQADAIAPGCRERDLQPLDQHHPIRQLRQRIVPGPVRQLGFDPAMLAHVVRGADELLADPVVVDERRDVDGDATRRGGSAPLRLERDGTLLARGLGERTYVSDERVRGYRVPQVAGDVVLSDELAVSGVRVDEPEHVVAVDRDRERGVGKQVEKRRVRNARIHTGSDRDVGCRGHVGYLGHRHERRRAPRSVVIPTARLPPCHVVLPRFTSIVGTAAADLNAKPPNSGPGDRCRGRYRDRMTCPACGAPVPEGARFCSECGQRLVATADERRLATVLMADLVDFTALAAASDPEQVKRLVDACFEALVNDIVDFGGRLDKIVGDEIVALFGAPVAHEDDAERGVRAALRMHETLTALAPDLGIRVQMRVGLNTGEVLVGAMRAGGDPTVMGDVVNTAQRLQKLAAPGQVIVGPATFNATRASIRYEALGPQGLRGREEPVDAYRAIDAPEPPGRRRVREQAPLLGRDAEVATLDHIIAMAAHKRRAHLVLLSGEAGVGKSRLASELGIRAARDLDAEVMTGQCVPYGNANVFVALAEALRRAFDTDEATYDDFRARVLTRVSKALDLPPEAAECDRMVEGLLYLMDGVTRPGVDPTRARDDALRSTIAFLEALTSSGPVVLTLSDLHWASDEALDLCNRMLARLHDHPFVLVATTRPGLEERWTPAPGRHNEVALHLDPLDRESTAELVRALFCGEADDETVEFLLERSGGNPFFVEELVAFVQESRDSERLHELPATLHGLVAARLDALDPAERSLLEDCAIVGDNGPIAAVLALAARADARRMLDALAERDFLVIEHDDFHFKSELIREIAYGTLTKAERARRHAVVAPVLAARGEHAVDQTAHHLATAAELVDELGVVDGVPLDIRAQAIDALMLAAERDESVESWLVAESHHDRALLLLSSDNTPARRTALLGRARARVHRRVLDDARDDTLTALAAAREAGDRRGEAVALSLLGEGEAAIGAYDVAEETFGEALAIWRELDDETGAADVLRGLGMTHLFRGDLAQAERFVSEALGSFRSSGNQRGAAWALQNLAWISFSHGNVPRAEQRLEESADLFGKLGDWGGLSWAYGLLAFVRYNQGRLDEAAAIAEHISIEGRETGNRWAVGMMDVLLANVALWNGRTRECAQLGNDAIRLFQDVGDRWGEVMATSAVVRAHAELGHDAEYESVLERYREVAESMPDEGMRQLPQLVEASVELQRGHAAEAERVLAGCEPDDQNDLGASDTFAALGLARLQLGDAMGAIEVLERVYMLAQDDGPKLGIGCRLALAYAVAHRCDDARAVLEELNERSGGTYSDRMIALWAESLVHVQTGLGDGRGSVDAAHAIATATDARLEHAIAALARAYVLRALGDAEADAAHDDAERQLDSLHITGEGWRRVFDLALDGVPERA